MTLKVTAALLSMIAVGVVLIIGVGVWAADWDGQFSFDEPVKAEQDPMIKELDSLPCGENVEMTPEEFPEVYRVFTEKIAAREEGALGLLDVRDGCSSDSIGTLSLANGLVGTLDHGDGKVHILAYTMDPTETATGLALSAVITAEGLEILEENPDRLAVLLGDTEEPEVEAQTEIDLAVPTMATSDLDCKWDSDTVCCAFYTEKKFCLCCSTLRPVQVACRCAPLDAN